MVTDTNEEHPRYAESASLTTVSGKTMTHSGVGNQQRTVQLCTIEDEGSAFDPKYTGRQTLDEPSQSDTPVEGGGPDPSELTTPLALTLEKDDFD